MTFRRSQAVDAIPAHGWLIYALVAMLLLAAAATPALAQGGLTRMGPVAFGGYPAWYQDSTGLAMEFCSPTNQSELDGGWCLLLPPGVFAPETFPNQFFDEHFYWSGSADGSADMTARGFGTGKALLTLALEGAFSVGPVIPGDQIVFARTRIVINPVPQTGTYTVYTPYGKYVFPNQAAGSKLFFTEDLGIGAPGDFALVLATGKTAPFLLPSATAGGTELPPITAASTGLATPYPGTGKKYIADPARVGPATGSPLAPFVSAVDGATYDHNVFRVEFQATGAQTPVVLLHTNNFSLMGRLFEGGIGGQVTVDRATYARSASSTKVDVFASGTGSIQPRLPSGPPPATIAPQLQYYDAPCVANLDGAGNFLSWSAPSTGTSHQMVSTPGGTNFWGQSAPPAVPSEVCVMQTNARDANGNTISAFFPTVVGDQVFITEASYDPGTQSMVVKAFSSDQMVAQTLTVTGYGDLAGGQYTLTGLIAPPSAIRVTSTGLGAETARIVTGVGVSGPGTTVPQAANDAASVTEDSPATRITVLANDLVGGGAIPAGSIVQLVALPGRGTAAVNVDGTISYTPAANFNGTDSFTYQVSVNGVASNVANVLVTVTAANDVPVAVNDSFNAVVNGAVNLPVLANDVDVDGTIGPFGLVGSATAVQIMTQPAAGATIAVNLDGTVAFTATAAGTYSFTYKAVDAASVPSLNTATATVTVGGTETITITLAQWERNKGRLRITGTVSPAANQRMEIRWANGSNTVSLVATPMADATGAWAIDLKQVTGIQNPDNSGATSIKVSTPAGAARIGALTIK